MEHRPEPSLLSYAPRGSPTGSVSRFLPQIVLALAVVVAGAAVLPSFRRPRGHHYNRNTDVTRSIISSSGRLGQAIELYLARTGEYPPALADLTTRPADPILAEKLGRVALLEPDDLTDCWNYPFQYRVPGARNPASYDLWSMGPDGFSETNDDIGNWQLPEGG